MTAGNVPLERQFSIFDEQRSSLVATNVVQKSYNNKLHFEVNHFKTLIEFESDVQNLTTEITCKRSHRPSTTRNYLQNDLIDLAMLKITGKTINPIHTPKIMEINQKQVLSCFIFHAYIHFSIRGAASVPKLLIQKIIRQTPHKIKNLTTFAPKRTHIMQSWTKST